VEDLSPYFRDSTVFVAPLRYGAGFKGKIALAMSHGLLVVTVSMGAEGMTLRAGQGVLIADDPEKFAEAVLRLCSDRTLWETLARNSRSCVENRWSSKAAVKILEASLRPSLQ